MPFAKCDLAIVSTAGHSRRTAYLLPAINPIRKLIVRRNVIELCSRLVVPRTPGFAAVHRNRCALIGSKRDDLGNLWIDPNRVIIVASRRPFPRVEGLPAIS